MRDLEEYQVNDVSADCEAILYGRIFRRICCDVIQGGLLASFKGCLVSQLVKVIRYEICQDVTHGHI